VRQYSTGAAVLPLNMDISLEQLPGATVTAELPVALLNGASEGAVNVTA